MRVQVQVWFRVRFRFRFRVRFRVIVGRSLAASVGSVGFGSST